MAKHTRKHRKARKAHRRVRRHAARRVTAGRGKAIKMHGRKAHCRVKMVKVPKRHKKAARIYCSFDKKK